MNDISFGKYISVLYRYTQIIINHQLKEYGLGSGQYLFLIAIAKSPGINQKELTAQMMNDKATTAKALSKLEALGYIERQKDEADRRNYKIFLSDKGEAFIPTLRAILQTLTSTLSTEMTASEIDQSKELLDKMLENAIKEVDRLK